jgi:hypothetical protein
LYSQHVLAIISLWPEALVLDFGKPILHNSNSMCVFRALYKNYEAK